MDDSPILYDLRIGSRKLLMAFAGLWGAEKRPGFIFTIMGRNLGFW